MEQCAEELLNLSEGREISGEKSLNVKLAV